jgi:hypothetical protein
VTVHRPTGWRPTAFYFAGDGGSAFTSAAILDNDGAPLVNVSDPVDHDGVRLAGPWVLESYDNRWGHARYKRPDGWTGATDGVFPSP